MEKVKETDEKLGNGDHFLGLLKKETSRLNSLVASAERELEHEHLTPEDVSGKMRVAVGKAKMLLRKKFVQFEQLCNKNLGIQSDIRYPVTPEDLAGYWDTIILQLLPVYSLFDEVEVLKKNNWKDPNAISSHNSSRGRRNLSPKVSVTESVRKSKINTHIA